MRSILIVITTGVAPTGALTTVMMNYYRKMSRDGLTIDFASYNTGNETVGLSEELKGNGGHYYCLGKRSHVLSYFYRLYKLCKGYDVIHVNGNSATTVIEHLAAKLAGVEKRINHNHTSIPDHKATSDLCYPFFNFLVTDRIACSDLAGNWLYGEGNFLILKNAVDIEKFQFNQVTRTNIRREFGISNDCVVLGHVGKIYKPKNHPYLIRLFAEYRKLNPNTKLFLVGDGIMRHEVEALVEELQVRKDVIFAGLRTDIPDMLQAMDYFVFPSIWEGMPLSVLEALSSGLTCIISDHITKDVMIGPNIHSLQIESAPKVWAEYINNYKLPSRNEACKQNSIAIAEAGFDIKVEAQKMRDIYLK